MNTPAQSWDGHPRVLRGAAGEGERAWDLNGDTVLSAEATSGDAMAALMLRLAGHVLTGCPVEARTDIGIILGTTTGCLAADAEFDRSRQEADGRYASPAAFARTLPSTVAAELSVKLKLGGPALTVSAGNASTGTALRRAAAWMRCMAGMGLCVAGGFEEFGGRVRGAVLLLGHPGVAMPAPERHDPMNAGAAADASLDRLIAWVQESGQAAPAPDTRPQSPPTGDR